MQLLVLGFTHSDFQARSDKSRTGSATTTWSGSSTRWAVRKGRRRRGRGAAQQPARRRPAGRARRPSGRPDRAGRRRGGGLGARDRARAGGVRLASAFISPLDLVAGIAAEHNLPLLVISAGTRNHFALDLGLDREDPSRCLDALRDGVELQVDLGVIADRPFVNNASFGAYAAVVQSPAYRDDKTRTTLDQLPGLLVGQRGPRLVARAENVTVEGPQGRASLAWADQRGRA
jgi:hypothetical protein